MPLDAVDHASEGRERSGCTEAAFIVPTSMFRPEMTELDIRYTCLIRPSIGAQDSSEESVLARHLLDGESKY